jgi:hypothetical protein
MKAYNEDRRETKSWGIALGDNGAGEVVVKAVDAVDGDTIALLITFYPSGRVVAEEGASNVLLDEGYDPKEHGNTFLPSGALKIHE